MTGVSSDISLHSINKYLPIGESDLDNALAWDKIPEVNFRRPQGEFKYSDQTVKALLSLSKERTIINKRVRLLGEKYWLVPKKERSEKCVFKFS